MDETKARTARLQKLYHSIVDGKVQMTRKNNILFLEAIYTSPDVASCIDRLIRSPKGLSVLQESMRMDLTATFFNGAATSLLRYVSSPQLGTIGGGVYLQQVVLSITEPPIFWSSFRDAFVLGQLHDDAQVCFSWLLLQLVLLPGQASAPHRATAQDPTLTTIMLNSTVRDVRSHAEAIKNIVATSDTGAANRDLEGGPGGRHDNDFHDFHDIAILPTADELASSKEPFLRSCDALDDPETADNRVAIHLDNQFRLLREDLLHELREELQVALGSKKGSHRGLVLNDVALVGLYREPLDSKRLYKWGVTFKLSSDLPFLKGVKAEKRRSAVEEDRKTWKNQSLTCLVIDEEIVAFPTVHRDEDLLAQEPSIIVLQFQGLQSVKKALLGVRTGSQIKVLQIDTAVFAYEPVLQALKEMTTLPMSQELLSFDEESAITVAPAPPHHIVSAIESSPLRDLQSLLGTNSSIKLDEAQSRSLLSGLTQSVSLIQGPPGTGKSFIGALLAKILHDCTQKTILVVCFTNHALDQFLEDLLKIGIPEESMVRLGGKSTSQTESLSLNRQPRSAGRSKMDWSVINTLKSRARGLSLSLTSTFSAYQRFSSGYMSLMEHLEFEHPEFFEAFCVPESQDGTKQVGRKGKAIGPNYLIERWLQGKDAGVLKWASNVIETGDTWRLALDARQTHYARWVREMLGDVVERVADIGQEYNDCQNEIEQKFNDGTTAVITSKRIIGCTTTGAAIHRRSIREAKPDVLLVEEAGEILESHILTALGPQTRQLILIGDHKQLRPKVNNYTLTVEKGDGFDLNRSLFERLVLKGYPHETLKAQHRMRPEISTLVRELTYPDLVDAPKTQGRPDLRGVRDNVVFIDHDHPEGDSSEIGEAKDVTTKASKHNEFEVQMVLKIVRYLAQQGYGTDKMVVLTPYLGQLRRLQLALKNDVDPVLNDLDTYDLVRAGLISPAAAKSIKKPLRIATIGEFYDYVPHPIYRPYAIFPDNYQGEESDVVIASLTRSNRQNDIGFMFSPERLTVLLSRARDAFIMIGNAKTFSASRKGGKIWSHLFDMLRHGSHMYSGLPAKCERHPDRHVLLCRPDDFEMECPEGGCPQPCGAPLSCGIHSCPMKCHQLSDHAKMQCEFVFSDRCPKGHQQSWKCQEGQPVSCKKCDRDDMAAEKRRQEEYDLQQKRDAEQQAHAEKLAEIERKIALERDTIRHAQLAQERANAIQEKQKELREASTVATQASSMIQSVKTSLTNLVDSLRPAMKSEAKPSDTQSRHDPQRKPESSEPKQPAPEDEWEHQKDLFGSANDALDSMMRLTGLKEVKEQVLRIKDKVDLSQRQSTSLSKERFNVSMLGNPGTGKTTVARLYGQFLASAQVIPGNMFIETTGARLANDGVQGIQKQLESIINAGGGTIFIDEAYQLTSEHNFEGKKVLDFLLAEMENQVGKVVFIFAGYSKEMESFFEHNPGLPSRVPFTLHFKDYEDADLMDMLEKMIHRKWSGRMKIDDESGIRGLLGRIAVRRLGRGRGTKGFGNARALENMCAKMTERQASRVSKARRQGKSVDDFLLVKEDIIGPQPSKVMVESKSWGRLQSMIGLISVKDTVRTLFAMVQTNYQRELLEKEPDQISLNRVFLGSPGTGKTTVAKLYGQILCELGLLSNGEVVVKSPADFIGSALGQSENQTKSILAATLGKVLVIDEAYMLYGGSGQKGASDQYKTAVIDTLVAEVQSVPGEDRCVLLLGYKDQMEEMFQNVNPGLARRFAIENAFHFEDYTDGELRQALEMKLKDQDRTATDKAKAVAVETLSRLRNRPNFGNIGEVENLLSKAKLHYQKRQASLAADERSPDAPFEPEDFDPAYARSEQAAMNLSKLFEDVIGCDGIIEKLAGWQRMSSNMKGIGRNPRDNVPTNFIFKGPPGTGKTTTARKMGQVYYDMGFLSSDEVVECSVSDLVGQYVGQTGPKTRQVFEKALGRVLFIDEAYRLGEGHFAKEAVDEVVDILTQEKFRGKLITILAGYDQEMNQLLAVNSGLASRFPEEIRFTNMSSEHCLDILTKKLAKQDIRVNGLEDRKSAEYLRMADVVNRLRSLPSWGNARDMETLAKQMTSIVFSSTPLQPSVVPPTPASTASKAATFVLADGDALKCMEKMLSDRKERLVNVPHARRADSPDMPMMSQDRSAPPPPPAETVSTAAKATAKPPSKPPAPRAQSPRDFMRGNRRTGRGRNQQPEQRATVTQDSSNDGRRNPAFPTTATIPIDTAGRDPGVSDHVWRQLQIAKQAQEGERRRAEAALRHLENQRRAAERKEREAREAAARLERAARAAREEKEREELMRRREQERLREIALRQEQARLEALKLEEERKRQEEARAQQKLRNMGVCVAGFQWIKVGGGYCCAGGSHYVSNAHLGI
ncbi:P-loop containing nucleoside triphosphate hydrolase protein [Gloeophyllum trabeum ATCC 11539]|uniref:p-loop containing nucleoside triphosphate hydrolase protein n=1 Tax=Gloeophyllum trabeum (strain ATCC 11539 / FP-39264 / Madison 617) TaxID=670483 RepID=S7RNM6_GLOTA|nr:P-loop containing nucleoside triphosphate hydrolase protein [Gloeophyllum trabeum ATCC 11539]EPQ56100.1 P-loop containing nucleoside triphosphate hydrolase protein [Gloeophyllum trabeum ATCC 11539]